VRLRWWLNTNDAHGPVLSGADGSFRIENIPPGKGVITAVFPGEPVPDWVAEDLSVTVASGETRKDVLVRALKGGVATFTVLSRVERSPLAGVRFSATSQLYPGPFPSLAVTGADGVVRLRLLPDTWHIVASVGARNGSVWQTNLLIETGRANAAEVLVDPVATGPVFKITGTARDPDGAPVGGAVVSLYGAFVSREEVTTDTSGRYEMTWSKPLRRMGGVVAGGDWFSLLARSVEHNLAVTHDIDEHTTNLDLTLQPCVTLSAKVVDTTGKPVTNAEGSAYMTRGNGSFAEDNPASKSDDRGLMEFTGIPQGDRYSLHLWAEGYVSASQRMKAPDLPTNRLEFSTFVLRPTDKKLAGRVLDLDDKPVAGVMVQAVIVSNIFQPSPDQPETGAVTQVFGENLGQDLTDAEGRFFFDAVCEGPIQLNANFEGFNTQTTGGATNVVLRLTRNGPNVLQRLPHFPNAKITGTVRDPAGAPAAGVRVSLSGDDGREEVQADADGRYAFKVRKPDSAEVPHGFIVARDEQRNLVAGRDIGDTTTNVDLSLRPGLALSVRVRDTNGYPIPGAVETLFVETEEGAWNFTPIRLTADDQGVIEIKALPQERYYTATITCRGYGTVKMDAREEDTRTNHFEFPAAVLPLADLEIAGQVLDSDEKPVPNVRVTLFGTQTGQRAMSDADGRFTFYGLAEGIFRLNVSSRPTDGAMQGESVARSGNTNVVIRLTAPGGVHVAVSRGGGAASTNGSPPAPAPR
jgi:protocatechuate 3,4-dioxygenase beta subunit